MKNPFEIATEGMSQEEKAELRKACGIGTTVLAADIETVEPLDPEEKKFFDPRGFISPYFSMQRIYKVQGSISPLHFNRVIFAAFGKEKNLRSNYCQVQGRWVKLVFKARRVQPEIIYRNVAQQVLGGEELDAALAKLAEAERRRPFSLAREPLARFMVVKTSANEFAVVVTGLGLAMRHLNMARFIVESQGYEYQGTVRQSLSEGARQGNRELSGTIMAYWQKVLDNLPVRPALPKFKPEAEEFSQSGYRVVVPSETVRLLKNTGGDINHMMGLVYTAWGLFLQYENHISDTYFLLLSDEGAKGKGGNLGMIPVRLKCPPKETVGSVASRLLKQLSISSPFSCFERKELETLLGERRGLFDHFLNFHAFTGTGVDYAGAEGTFAGNQVYEQSWDAQGLPLGIYFQYVEGSISLSILYNRYSISEKGLEELCGRYILTLHTMLLHMDSQVASFDQGLRVRLESKEEKATVLSERNIMALLRWLPYFQGIVEEKLYQVARAAKLRTYFENDQIIMNHDQGQMFFLLEGRVARLMDPGSGWYSMLDVAKEGKILNETVMMEQCKSSILGEVLSEKARVLIVPLPQLMDVALGSSSFRKAVTLHILGEMEKYQRRWVNS